MEAQLEAQLGESVLKIPHAGESSYISIEQAVAELHEPDAAGNPYYKPRNARGDLEAGLQCLGPRAVYWLDRTGSGSGVM